MIYHCDKCGDAHRLSQNALLAIAELSLEGRMHYVKNEKVRGGKTVTVVETKCPFEIGITRTRYSETGAVRKSSGRRSRGL